MSANINFVGNFVVNQSGASLAMSFNAEVRNANSAAYSANVIIKNATSIDRSCNVEIRNADTINRSANVEIRNASSADMSANVEIKNADSIAVSMNAYIYFVGSDERSGSVVIRNAGSIAAPMNVVIRNVGSIDLSCSAEIKNSSSIDRGGMSFIVVSHPADQGLSSVAYTEKVERMVDWATMATIVCTANNTEYSLALPAGTKRFRIIEREFSAIRVAYVAGQVADAATGIWDKVTTLPIVEDDLLTSVMTIYVASYDSGKVVEVTYWR